MADANGELIAQARRGNDEALEALLTEAHSQLRARLEKKIRQHHRGAFDASDVLQVTYTEAFLRIRGFTGSGRVSFQSWLTTIAENNLRDAVRELERQKRPPRARQLQPQSGDDSYLTLLGNLSGAGTSPSSSAAKAEAKDLIESAMKQLPPDYATVIRLYDLEATPINEVAASLGRSAGAVHMLKARAHDRLKELLGDATNFFSRPA